MHVRNRSNPPALSACTVCQPSQLESLIRSDPALMERWNDLPTRSVEAGKLLQGLGEVSTRCWHVRQGLVRLFYLNAQGAERNRSFHDEGSWVAGSLPPLAQPSPFAIEAMTPVEVVELPYATLRQWRIDTPHVGSLLDEALSCDFQQHAKREAELLTHPLEVRYQSFLENHGELALRLPQHHVASYLGVSPVSLSRIRKRLGLIEAQTRG